MTNPIDPSPTVSVVIPSYNHRRFVAIAIDSALAQTFADLEVVVVDDGSRDDSAAFLLERYRDEPRVRLYARENRGAHATLDEAIARSRGRYVAILNSDDVYDVRRIETLVERARARSTPYFGITGLSVVDERGAPAPDTVPAGYYASVASRMASEPTIASFWVGNYAMTTSNFFFSRSIYESVGGFAPLRYLHDWDFGLRASESFGLDRVDEVLLHYRVHGGNTIAEGEPWKKLVEKSYVFARALRRVGLDGMARAAGVSPAHVMRALAKNRSFLPIPTLLVLGLGLDGDALDRALASGELERMLREFVRSPAAPPALFGSFARLCGALGNDASLVARLAGFRPIRRVATAARSIERTIRARIRSTRA